MEQPVIERRKYSAMQRWLLPAALLIGFIWDFGWRREGLWAYGLFWGVYLLVFYAFNWSTLRHNRLCWTLAAAAVLLCGRCAWPEESLYAMLLAGIPLILMTHAVFATADIPKKREGAAVLLALKGFFVRPFSAVPAAFGAFVSLFERRGEGRFKRLLLGLAIGLPLAAAVLALLISADEMMARLLGGLVDDLRVGNMLGHALNVLIAALLFYSFLYNSRWGGRDAVLPREKRNAPPMTAAVVLALLLIVYALFGYVQFRYLFSGKLPAELSYAAYARRGFGELIVVALINFSAYTAINALCREGGALRILQCLLLAATAILLASAMLRLMMYIGAYGLTVMRILPLWLMIWLAALDILAVLRLFRPQMPMLRISALTLVWWFVALNIPNWTETLAALNLRYF